MKNPLTQSGIEPATFRSLTQHLNHCAVAPLPNRKVGMEFSYIISLKLMLQRIRMLTSYICPSTARSNLNRDSKETLTATPKRRGPRFTEKWNSGEQNAAGRHVEQSE